ncbi:hypothetical protein EMIHUDRAFT_359919 [Emiliania huxleyi CCMP1516]|uniref:DUF1565 domain-containing protein n=2 Tax=Emiliania huxleyi TaxID=2903 RepID=A0A0D3I316_EMIH1|nr:hypothetical protein EMIHUDRAFT_359919 [Emiliania huxleyi CCMP1516]EOD05651.1 hypothetical protein EMIHUDRAFT_359919 [Emiliania huxleyi CCMP1516]|eukprot:XP_005758080.1 hypothetical protein EMIHUDRAFT_359919 [Emiliania huxleyi CCMP1516]
MRSPRARASKALAEFSGSITRRTLTLAAALAASTSPTPSPAMEGMAMDAKGGHTMESSIAFFPGAPYIVDPAMTEVNTFSTISAALAAAPSGSTVIVRPGTYNERLIIRKTVNLLCPRVVLDWTSGTAYEAAVDVDLSGADAGNVYFMGLTVRHSCAINGDRNAAVYVHSPTRKVALEFPRLSDSAQHSPHTHRIGLIRR